MWDRTITIGSAGKTFSVTGWKVRNPGKPERSSHNVIVNKQRLRMFFFFFFILEARLVHRTRTLGQASSDRHAEHSVHLPDSSAGKRAAPRLLVGKPWKENQRTLCVYSEQRVCSVPLGGRGSGFASEPGADGSAGVLLLLPVRGAGGQEGPPGSHPDRCWNESHRPRGRILHAGGRHLSQWAAEILKVNYDDWWFCAVVWTDCVERRISNVLLQIRTCQTQVMRMKPTTTSLSSGWLKKRWMNNRFMWFFFFCSCLASKILALMLFPG